MFEISRPGVSRHLRVLRNARLVNCRMEAQKRVYSLQTEALEELDAWLEKYRVFWSQRLDALSTEIEREKRQIHKADETHKDDQTHKADQTHTTKRTGRQKEEK